MARRVSDRGARLARLADLNGLGRERHADGVDGNGCDNDADAGGDTAC